MALLPLAWRSLRNRAFTAALTVFTIALAIALLLGVERLRHQARESFLRTVAGTDLIVGARAHPVQLLLYSVFHLGDATNNLSWEAFQRIAQDGDVAWVVPVSLGDSHRGYRVVGTSADYFQHVGETPLAFAAGTPFAEGMREGLFEAVVGADVANRLGYAPGQHIVLAHGTARVNLHEHDDRPFTIVGVLARTGSVHDRGIYVSLASIQAIHLNWRSGTRVGAIPDAELIPDAALEPASITAAFIGLESRMATFAVQRAINEERSEPLSAILPGVALQQLWSLLGGVERLLFAIAGAVLLAAMLALSTMILATLNERRREMAILRSVGAGPRHVLGLMLLESSVLTVAGAALALMLLHAAMWLAAPWLQARFGIALPLRWPDAGEWKLLGIASAAGVLAGLLPAFLACRRSVQDGMTVTL